MAQMLEDLRVAGGMRVLEIGAGTGYNAALLAHVAGSGLVFSVDVDRQVLSEAAEHLCSFAEREVQLRHADGRAGLPQDAPFDRIVVTAATPDLEPAWLRQTREDGILLAPLVLAPGLAYIARGWVRSGVFEGRLTRTAWFLPLRGERDLVRDDVGVSSLPSASARTAPAPWADWIESKRSRLSGMGFLQAIAFYSWLRGCRISYEALRDGQTAFGLHDPASSASCWISAQDWICQGDSGPELGEAVWRGFRNAGGPWPNEFRLRTGIGEPPPPPTRPESYIRRGPFCWQTWELIDPRDRPAGFEGF